MNHDCRPRPIRELLADALIYAELKTGGRMDGRATEVAAFLDATGYIILRADDLIPDTAAALIGNPR